MTKILVTSGNKNSHTVTMALALATIGIQVADEVNDCIVTCPTGHEDWPIYKTPSIEPLNNNETWRGRGKRKKSICK